MFTFNTSLASTHRSLQASLLVLSSFSHASRKCFLSSGSFLHSIHMGLLNWLKLGLLDWRGYEPVRIFTLTLALFTSSGDVDTEARDMWGVPTVYWAVLHILSEEYKEVLSVMRSSQNLLTALMTVSFHSSLEGGDWMRAKMDGRSYMASILRAWATQHSLLDMEVCAAWRVIIWVSRESLWASTLRSRPRVRL